MGANYLLQTACPAHKGPGDASFALLTSPQDRQKLSRDTGSGLRSVSGLLKPMPRLPFPADTCVDAEWNIEKVESKWTVKLRVNVCW